MAVSSLKDNVRVEITHGTNLFVIRATDFDPVAASKIANIVSRSYVIFDLEQQMAEIMSKYGNKHPLILQLNSNIRVLTQKLKEERLSNLEAIGPASVKIIEQAVVPLESVGRIPKGVLLIVAFLLGCVASLVLAVAFDHMDQTLKTPDDVDTYLRLPTLGSIPTRRIFDKPVVTGAASKSLYGRSYRALSDQAYLALKDKSLKSVLVTSTSSKEGVSTSIANLASHWANTLHHKVLIIDANFRTSSMHKVFKLKGTLGLTNILEGKTSFTEAVYAVSPNLHVLQAGKTKQNPIFLLDSPELKQFLEEVESQYEIILWDCPNLGSYKDASVLSAALSASVALVIREGKENWQVVNNAVQPFRQLNGNFLGVVLNRRSYPIPSMIYKNI